jgi:hypothetical protein
MVHALYPRPSLIHWAQNFPGPNPLSLQAPFQPEILQSQSISQKVKPLCFFPIKRPKLLVKAKAGSVLRPIPTPHFSMDAGASTSAVQLAPIGLGSGNSTSASRLGFSSRIYHRRKVRKSTAVWKVKEGQAKPEAGSTLSGEKAGLISMVGDEASFPAFENVLCGGGGESEALQLAIRQPKELAVASPGSESDCSRQSGFGSDEARKTTSLEKKGSVVEEDLHWFCRKLLEVCCWLLRFPVPRSMLFWGISSLVQN